MAIPLGRSLPSASCDRPERRREGPPGISGSLRGCLPLLLGLAPGGVFPAAAVAGDAVRSYRTVSPCLPPGMPETGWRCTFCGTFPGVAPAGGYPAPHLRGARTFLSPRTGEERPSNRLATRDLGSRSSSVKAPAEASIIGFKRICIARRRGTAMPVILGTDGYRYEVSEGWAKLPPGMEFNADVAAVGVDSHDNVYAFNRGKHPMCVFDRHGNFLRSWGEGIFVRPHGVFMAPD